eukprot:snap_masked-scaffold_4-processed-gene-15.27-mRNA-1 protein AED:1.00 eAED:1.00 QI:0/0/0/0/1/1/2/0/1933
MLRNTENNSESSSQSSFVIQPQGSPSSAARKLASRQQDSDEESYFANFETWNNNNRLRNFYSSGNSSSFGASFASAQNMHAQTMEFYEDLEMNKEKLNQSMQNYRKLIYGGGEREIPPWQRLNPLLPQPWKRKFFERGKKHLKSWYFQTFIMICVLVNAIMLALFDPVKHKFGLQSERNDAVQISEKVFISIFTVEAVSKIIFFGYKPYFKSGWNCFDFFLVVLGLISFFLSDSYSNVNFSALRCLRILRIFKNLTYIKNLGLMVRALLESSKQLAHTGVLFAVFFLVFSLAGVILFEGRFRQRCVNETDPSLVLEEQLCSMDSHYGYQCKDNYVCHLDSNSSNLDIITSFDSLPSALFTVFEILTLEGWVDIMYSAMDTSPVYYAFYFILIVLFGSFFLLNLFVVVLSTNYSRLREEKQIGKVNSNKIYQDVAAAARLRSERRNDLLNLDIRQQIKQTEFRLMYSYEKHHKEPTYKTITKKEYDGMVEKYKFKMIEYTEWKEEHVPLLEKKERSERLGLLRSKTFSRSLRSGDGNTPFDVAPPIERENIGLNFMNRNVEDNLSFNNSDLNNHSLVENDSSEEEEQQGEEENQVRNDLLQETHRLLNRAQMELQNDDSMVPVLERLRSALESPPPEIPTSITIRTQNSENNSLYGGTNSIQHPGNRAQSALNLIGQSMRNVKKVLNPPEEMPNKARGLLTENKFVILAYTIVKNLWFQRIIAILIALNIILLSLQRFDADEKLALTIYYGNLIFTIIFFSELCLKLYAFGAPYYFSNFFNVLDVLVIVPSVFELAISGTTAISAFRILRLFQIFSLPLISHYAEHISHLLHVIGLTLRHVCPFALVLLIFIFLCAVSGLHLFGGELAIEFGTSEYDCFVNTTAISLAEGVEKEYLEYCPQRSNYDTFMWSFVTTFQVITLEDWNAVFSSIVQSSLDKGRSLVLPYVYFILVITFGPFLILQLFLAVLIDIFNESHSDRVALQKQAIENEKNLEKFEEEKTLKHQESEAEGDAKGFKRQKSVDFTGENEYIRVKPKYVERMNSQKTALSTNETLEDLARKIAKRRRTAKTKFNPDAHASFKHYSLFCLSPENSFRQTCAKIINNRHVENIILVAVIYSCCLLAVDEDHSRRGVQLLLEYSNIFLATLFSIEVVMKIISFGMFMSEGAYFHDKWNVIDFVVTVTMIIDLVSSTTEKVGAITVLRALRILRPLRVVRRFENLRIIVRTLMKALVPCLQVGFICIVVYWASAVLCVTFFGGKTYACYYETNHSEWDFDRDPSLKTCHEFEQYVDDETYIKKCTGVPLCEEEGGTWRNPTYGSITTSLNSSTPFEFDTLFSSMLTLYEVSTLESWPQVMFTTTDITYVGVSPRRGASDGIALWWVFFVAASNFFLLQVFVAVVVETFLLTSDKETGSAFMSPKQVRWVEARHHAAKSKPPSDMVVKANMSALSFVKHTYFKNFITVVIVLNTIVLATKHFNQGPGWTTLQQICDYIFGAIYTFEAVCKILAFGPKNYFSKPWNRFDFFIVLAVILEFVFTATAAFDTSDQGSLLLRNVEILRVFRVFRLLGRVKGVAQLLETLVSSLPSIVNISCVLFLALFMFAVLAVQLFPGQYSDNADTKDFSALNDYANFDNFWVAMLTLIRMATGEQWNAIMHDYETMAPEATWFCIMFMLVVQFIVLNLFVAVILSEFLLSFNNLKRDHEVTMSIQEFSNAWCKLNTQWGKLLTKRIENDLLKRKLNADGSSTVTAISGGQKLTKQERRVVRRMVREMKDSRYLPYSFYHRLIESVPSPLGLKGLVGAGNESLSPVEKMRIMSKVNIPVTKTGLIHYQETLSALVDDAMSGNRIPPQVQQLLEYRLPNSNRPEPKTRIIRTEFGLSELYATTKLQLVIRNFVAINRAKRLQKQGYTKEQIQEMMIDSKKKALAAKVFTAWLS